jgi:hypothetical protein
VRDAEIDLRLVKVRYVVCFLIAVEIVVISIVLVVSVVILLF